MPEFFFLLNYDFINYKNYVMTYVIYTRDENMYRPIIGNSR